MSARISNKLQSESQLTSEIHGLEKEIKTSRIEIERREAELRLKQLAVSSDVRHNQETC